MSELRHLWLIDALQLPLQQQHGHRGDLGSHRQLRTTVPALLRWGGFAAAAPPLLEASGCTKFGTTGN